MTTKFNLTGVVLAHKADELLIKSLASLDFCQQVLVVVHQDNEGEVRQWLADNKLEVDWVIHQIEDDFAAIRNFATKQVSSNWVFYLDSDEWVSPKLKSEIKRILQSNNFENQVYLIKRDDYFIGQLCQYGVTHHNVFPRLVNLETKPEWRGQVHEVLTTNGRGVLLKNHLFHQPSKSISDFVTKINWYTTIVARQPNTKIRWYQWFYPIAKFLYNFIYLWGWKDGSSGLYYAYLMSIHSLMVRAKSWEISNK